MEEAMVTARMSPQKKKSGNAILKSAGLNASQAINMMYTKLIESKSVDFLDETTRITPAKVQLSQNFIDSLVLPISSDFVNMTDKEIRESRLRNKGLM